MRTLRKTVILVSAIVALVVALGGTALGAVVSGPDGELLFASQRPSAESANPDPNGQKIWETDSAGAGSATQLTTIPEGVQHRDPDWSPDHRKFVFTAGDANSSNHTAGIWLDDLDRGTTTQIVPNAPGTVHPVFSPDGAHIAYVSNGKLWLQEPRAGGAIQELAGPEAAQPAPGTQTFGISWGMDPTGTKQEIFYVAAPGPSRQRQAGRRQQVPVGAHDADRGRQADQDVSRPPLPNRQASQEVAQRVAPSAGTKRSQAARWS